MEKNKKLIRIVLIGMFIIFGLTILFLAFKLKMGVSPDSFYHLDVSKAYSTTLGIPSNTPQTYQYRDITRIAYLYFWINGRILDINKGLINEVLLLRIVNIIYSLGTVYITYLLSKEILKGKWKKLFPVFLLTNTLMFVFLSSSINYDNLANLLSVLSIFFFVKFVKSELKIKHLLLMILFLCLGALTKYTLLPLAFILVVLSLIDVFIKRERLKDIRSGKEILLLFPVLISIFLNLALYGVNLFKYGSLDPNCERILTHEQCLENGVYYRDNLTFPSTKVGGFKGVFDLIKSGDRIDPISYFGKWIINITDKIFGIMGDSSLFMPKYFKYLYLFFLSVGIFLSAIFYKRWNRVDKYLMIITLFYISILFLFWNYNMYLKHDHLYLGLQGRYIFPVISIMYILFSKAIFFLNKKWMIYSILVSLIILFFYGCIPFFVLNVESWWLGGI